MPHPHVIDPCIIRLGVKFCPVSALALMQTAALIVALKRAARFSPGGTRLEWALNLAIWPRV